LHSQKTALEKPLFNDFEASTQRVHEPQASNPARHSR